MVYSLISSKMVLLNQLEANWDESKRAFVKANQAFRAKRAEVYHKYKNVSNLSANREYFNEEREVYELFRKRIVALECAKREGRLLVAMYNELYPLSAMEISEELETAYEFMS